LARQFRQPVGSAFDESVVTAHIDDLHRPGQARKQIARHAGRERCEEQVEFPDRFRHESLNDQRALAPACERRETLRER